MAKKHKKLLVLIILLAIFSGAGLAGFMLAGSEPRVAAQSSQPSFDVQAGADSQKIAKGAAVDWDYEYKMCTHHIYLRSSAEEAMTGLTFSELRSQHPDIRIISFSPDKLVLNKSFECYCPNHYILKHYKDELAVFRTITGTDDQQVYLEVQIKFSGLGEDEREVLEAGKLFGDLDEMENYLENLET